ncbi:MAG: prolyl oligopeptidase family serine peptidase [Planctomycetota bacterium]
MNRVRGTVVEDFAVLALLLALTFTLDDSPVSFARSELRHALETMGLQERATDFAIEVTGRGEPESFSIRVTGGRALVEGADEAGAMYGGLELSERLTLLGMKALEGETISKTPYLSDRGLNVFLTLPWDYEKNDSDHDPQALIDPQRWWFHDEGYWTALFDLMARARLNWLDLHGTWDVSVTDAPNLYAYFIQSEKYPEIGVAPEIKAANLRQLNHVIEKAHARGIRVSVMAYEAKIDIPQNPHPPYPDTEEVAYDYTREVVEKMIREAPGLDAIGFRIGESGRSGEFFNCYLQAVERSGRNIPLTTRSWVTRKRKVVPLARQSSDFTVEIKYNGEQWGAPYLIAGGRVAGWYSYSFEDYLSDSNAAGASSLWPGHPTPDGSRWADQPYKIVWQVRANGTHRVFPFYNPQWVRRSILAMKIGTASGYTVEPLNAYYPASPRYYLANPSDQYLPWIIERDEMYVRLWGRLGYDPETPDAAFDNLIASRLPEVGSVLPEAWRAASLVVPIAFSAYSLGPDHRSQAPELEWGGGTAAFIEGEPFDSHAFMSVKELLAFESTGGKDGRLTPLDAAHLLTDCFEKSWTPSLSEVSVKESERGALRELGVAINMLGYLARYYSGRLLSAWALAAAEANPEGAESYRARAFVELQNALDAWGRLSESPDAQYYRPFTERLRMHTNTFHWRAELDKVRAEAERVAALRPPGQVAPQSLPARRPLPPDVALKWQAEGEKIVCALRSAGLERAWLLEKPLPSSTFFHKRAMPREGERFVARFARKPCGHLVAAEIESESHVWRLPSWFEQTPYLVIPSQGRPTPLYYSSQEALSYLRPDVLRPDKHGLLLLSSRAWDFHRGFDVAMQRKLLEAVERGMTLLVLQQDYTSGRYPLDWLPGPPRLENRALNVFDPGEVLGLTRFEATDIVWQPFLAAEGWDVFGNGSIAHRRMGAGEIWMVQGRLIQRMNVPESARTLLRLLTMKGTEKPVIVIDAGSEGAHYATSVIADFMNAHEIPFLTLGEVVAEEQGLDSLEPVPGGVWPDRILEGRGATMMKAFLEGKVKAAAARPVPETREAFEQERERRREELLRCLGLAPPPPRTPLNARVTGVIERAGYRIEKVVYESRPGFPVTAHLYVPQHAAAAKLPVIVNPHGHWQHKKQEPVVQTRAIAQALHGYLAMVIDSPGHSFEGDTRIERRWAGTHDDLRLLLGSSNAAAIYVWDLMRALDYLETREEADMERVGITGTSGGGLATLYAFAAEERFKVAVPVCYATSLEVNPHNGCLCNHVPGTLQVGDRADVLAIRAPAPVFVIGARSDPEFPPAGTELTGEKLRRLYALFGAEDATRWQIVESGHDYNREMREAALGFFDRHLRGLGDGSPVSEPEILPEPAGAPELFCLPDPPEGLATMRDIARAKLAAARPRSFADVVALNGGLPAEVPLNFRAVGPEGGIGRLPFESYVAFESEAGLTIPGILIRPLREARAAVVLVAEQGKLAALREFPAQSLVEAGFACLAIDVRGFGELPGLDARLMAYFGTADALAMGWDAARAAKAAAALAPRVAVVGRGPCGAQVALFAALFNPAIDLVVGLQGLESYAEALGDDIPTYSIQPRADLGAPLEHLRSLVKSPAVWTFRGESDPELREVLEKHLAR